MVKFWTNNWINGMGCLSNFLEVNIIDEERNQTVSKLVTSTGTQNWIALNHRILEQIKHRLVAMLSLSNKVGLDVLRWKHTVDGSFTIKSA